jgi:hypothetical protein
VETMEFAGLTVSIGDLYGISEARFWAKMSRLGCVPYYTYLAASCFCGGL